MRRKRRAEGRVKDAEGIWWDVSELRSTKHGFDVVLGWRSGKKRGTGGAGRPGVVLTKPLLRHLERFRMNPGKADLPLCWTAIWRIRERLGHNVRLDTRKWWEDRRKDLAGLSGFKFAAKHGKSPQAAHRTHRILLGRQHRPNDWWTQTDALAILTSDQTDAEMAAALSISPNSVRRLRSQCRRTGIVREEDFAPRPKRQPWWMAPDVRAVLASGRSYVEMADTLGISTSKLGRIISESRRVGLGPPRRYKRRVSARS